MNTFDQIREGLGRAWSTVADGWHEISQVAAHALTRFSPKHPASELETAEEQTARAGSRWGLLPAEVRDVGEEIEVRLEVPGMEAEDFSIRVEGDVLVVSGEKHVEREDRRGHYHLMERAYGSFQRAIALPAPVDESRADASYRRGVLVIKLPKDERATPRRIPVKG